MIVEARLQSSDRSGRAKKHVRNSNDVIDQAKSHVHDMCSGACSRISPYVLLSGDVGSCHIVSGLSQGVYVLPES